MVYSKTCKFGCNTKIEWDTSVGKFVEVEETNGQKLFHSKERCEKLLRDQGLTKRYDKSYTRSAST